MSAQASAAGPLEGVDRQAAGRDWHCALEPPDHHALDLGSGLPAASIFLSDAWSRTWAAEAGLTPHRLVVRDAHGRLRGMGSMTMSNERRRGGLVRTRCWNLNTSNDAGFDSVFIEYNGLAGADADVGPALDAALAHMAAVPGWDEWHIHAVPQDLAARIAARWPRHRIVWHAPTFRVDLESLRRAGRDHAATLSRNTRQQIARARRLFERSGPLRLEAAASTDEALAFFDALERLHKAGWRARGKGDGAFTSPFFRRFHRRWIEHAWPRGRVELLRVRAGDDLVGCLYNLLHDGTAHAYQSGFAATEDNRLKPGLLCHTMAIERHLRLGTQIYDLMAGDQRYKASLAEPGPELQSLVLWRPRPLLLAEDLLRRWRTHGA
ncbi:MAG: GNAT family N-acetyltransferase [Geminicoccaceae bacterium]|nr:GNAT family N-acetyltransferase [Geminicoccaceae bacterium]